MKNKFSISASIMCADLMNLQRDIMALQNANVEYFHLDVMDGHFVDNITLGFDCCRTLASYPIPRDIHLLVQNPENHIQKMLLKDGDIFQFHYESGADVGKITQKVHRYGAKVGVVLNVETKIQMIEPWLDDIDVVTLMMIRPGFAGLPMEPGMLEKISKTREYLDMTGHSHIVIEVDGHVNVHNISEMCANGASILVAGSSSVFRKDISIEEGIKTMRECVENDT